MTHAATLMMPMMIIVTHWTEYNITETSVHLSGVCGQDCDVICGLIFTKFGT